MVGAPSDGTDGGAPFVLELVDLDAATAARAAWWSAALLFFLTCLGESTGRARGVVGPILPTCATALRDE